MSFSLSPLAQAAILRPSMRCRQPDLYARALPTVIDRYSDAVRALIEGELRFNLTMARQQEG